MKKNSPSIFRVLLLVLLSFTTFSAFAQNKEEVSQIIKNYDLKKIKELQVKYHQKARLEKQHALKVAKLKNWPEFIVNENGTVDELIKLTPDGFPLYYSVNNKNAAKTTRANFLNTGGAMGLNLNGQGMVARVWDGGKVRASHQEFGGRITVNDNVAGPTGNNFHSTHVTGTIAASGVDADAKGMAPQAQVRTFNWGSDISEVLSEVQGGMLLSNHSYGVPIVNNGDFVPSWYIGAYSDDSRAWDEVAFNSPYYLMVASAGNNGNDENPSPSTLAYDKLTGNKTSKNNLVVANSQDAIIATNGSLTSVAINSSSSQGPADDLRIKPDITGNGTNVYSTFESSDNDYGSISGTSMASPNVTGTLLLLQQHYKNKNNRFMKAATLKALACHTADDAGRPGPDAVFGWGLLNAKKAAETITGNGLVSWISEETLQQGQTFTMTVNSNGVDPLQASIVWADVPGVANNGTNNDLTPALVNDLDIRITKATSTYYPWRLLANATSNAVNNGDNNVDNVEKVSIPSASGTYTIIVTHKGTLQQGPQNFSLVITGMSSAFALSTLSEDQIVCNTGTATYTFNHIATNAIETTTFSAVNLPAGVTANLSATSMSDNGDVTMTLSNLQGLAPGNYTIGFQGTRGTETEIRYVALKVYSSTFSNITLASPANNATGLSTAFQLEWNAHQNAESYRIQVATDASFTNLIVNEIVTETNYLISNLTQATNYYWRVLPKNRCGEATSGTTFNFQTGDLTCNNVFTATDFTDAVIGSSENSQGFVPITVTGGMTVGSLTASISINHTYIEDMTIYLEGPEALGFPFIKLFEEPCGDNDNIVATLSDAGIAFTCGNTAPSITGTVRPKEPLSNFNNLPADGVWTLYAIDAYDGDGGVINSFSLNFCNVATASLSVGANELLNVSVYPNPTKGILNVRLPQNSEITTLNLNDIQGRKILSKETANTDEVLNIENLSDGVYILSIQSGSLKTTKKIVLNR